MTTPNDVIVSVLSSVLMFCFLLSRRVLTQAYTGIPSLDWSLLYHVGFPVCGAHDPLHHVRLSFANGMEPIAKQTEELEASEPVIDIHVLYVLEIYAKPGL